MIPKNIHEQDDFLKNQFEDFQAPPPAHVWENIDQQMLSQELEEMCKDAFETYEPSPRPEMWQQVSKQLPLSLLLRKHLYQLSKVAAVLLLIMLISVVIDRYQPKSTIAEATTPLAINSTEQVDEAEAVEKEFVMDIEEDPIDKSIARRLLEKEEEESVDDLWAFITDDNDDFSEALNEEKLKDILKPLEKLPIEGLAMVLPKEKEKAVQEEEIPEITIMIPLKVVEDHEVEKLLTLYDQQEQNTRTVQSSSN